jgi:hypothetical protein
MVKFLKLPINMIDKNQTIISISLEYEAIPEWCLDLCLLENDLIQSVVITNDPGTFKLTISKNPSLSRTERGRVKWHSGGAEIQISQTELDMWCDYFLRYYRDGIANVDHIDVDISPKKDARGLFITFKVDSAVPSIPEKEARRKLNLLGK